MPCASGAADALRLLDARTLEPVRGAGGGVLGAMSHPSFEAASRHAAAVLSPCGSHAVAGTKGGLVLGWATAMGAFEVEVGGVGGGGLCQLGHQRGQQNQ